MEEKISPFCSPRIPPTYGGPSWPVDDVSALEVVEGQHQLTDEQFHSAFLESHVLLEVVPQVPSEQQVYHHEHVLFVLEWVPATA